MYPRFPHRGIGKRRRVDWRTGSKAETDEGIDGPPCFDRGQVNDEIDISGESRKPMQNRRDTTDHDVAHVGSVQCLEERLQQRHGGSIGFAVRPG